MTGKLFKDVKNSVTEIISDYKKKREETEKQPAGEIVSSQPSPTKEEEKKSVTEDTEEKK